MTHVGVELDLISSGSSLTVLDWIIGDLTDRYIEDVKPHKQWGADKDSALKKLKSRTHLSTNKPRTQKAIWVEQMAKAFSWSVEKSVDMVEIKAGPESQQNTPCTITTSSVAFPHCQWRRSSTCAGRGNTGII